MSDKKHDVNAVTTEPNVEDQDYIYTPVPQNKRYGWIKMFFVWLCWNVVVGDLATGTALGSSMKFRDALKSLNRCRCHHNSAQHCQDRYAYRNILRPNLPKEAQLGGKPTH